MKLASLPDGSPEIFYSIQGEGRNTGMPAVFIRASLCNLHCHWCDTDYTWNWEDTDFSHEKDADPGYQKFKREQEIIDLPIPEIVDLAGKFPANKFIFTGGEPLLQEKGWIELMDLITEKYNSGTESNATLLEDAGVMQEILQVHRELGTIFEAITNSPHFEIETNGTLLPSADFLGKIHQINVSPKLENSRVAKSSRLNLEVLRTLALSGKADFKFVVQNTDLAEVLDIIEKSKIPADRVFLMPMASSVEELNANQESVATAVQENGFRYSDRLHLRLFGAKRGV